MEKNPVRMTQVTALGRNIEESPPNPTPAKPIVEGRFGALFLFDAEAGTSFCFAAVYLLRFILTPAQISYSKSQKAIFATGTMGEKPENATISYRINAQLFTKNIPSNNMDFAYGCFSLRQKNNTGIQIRTKRSHNHTQVSKHGKDTTAQPKIIPTAKVRLEKKNDFGSSYKIVKFIYSMISLFIFTPCFTVGRLKVDL